MKISSLILFIILCVFISCNNKINTQNTNNDKISLVEINKEQLCDSSLYDIIYNYSKNIPRIENEIFYISIYFFEHHNTPHFTIWMNYLNPIKMNIFDDKKNDYEFTWLPTKINGAYIVCIRSKLFKYRIPYNNKIREIIDTSYESNYYYDGRWYFQSYSYAIIDDRFTYKKLNEPITFFFKKMPQEFL